MSFGFDPETVFGGMGFGNGKRKKSRSSPFQSAIGSNRKKDDMQKMMDKSMNGVNGANIFGGVNLDLGIETFSTKENPRDVLRLGADFGDVIGKRAGQANGKEGGFLGTIGSQQAVIPRIVGREPTPSGARRAKRARRTSTQTSGFTGLARAFGGLEERVAKRSATKRKEKKQAEASAERESKKAEAREEKEAREQRQAEERAEEREIKRDQIKAERERTAQQARGGQSGATFF